ncbi:caspase family protein [Mycobacterium sp.]|uniref:caspase family protein n=1 Tax=Mycobacterium sp. TaxID=1785 RepID=UPI00257DEA61|nr:caspase family protein [Mycobacterium sp.]
MTQIIETQSEGPQIHVLAIGVGAYRHLRDGSEPVDHDTLGLKQLTGPPHSVLAFVEWITRINHPTARLGTVELLVSPEIEYRRTGGSSIKVEAPSASNVEDAFERWYRRCDERKSNVAVFYFCGHGVELNSQFLLLEDFGKSNLALLKNSIDIGDLYAAMKQCQARAQYYFVDACRGIPAEFYGMLKGEADKLLQGELGIDPRTDSVLLFATSGGSKAYGKPNEPTLFTQALIRALDGLGSRNGGSGWVVNMSDVQRAITLLTPKQLPAVRHCKGVGELHILAHGPTVPVNIGCDPAAAVAEASIAVTSLRRPDATLPEPHTNSSGWSYELPADLYRLEVRFIEGTYRGGATDHWVHPPVYNTTVVVSP